MALLPREALELNGGCYCQAIRYSIKIPPLEDRPAIPNALDTPIAAGHSVKTLFPLIGFDHCTDCRQSSGAIVQCWIICPTEWVKWSLLPKPTETKLAVDDEILPSVSKNSVQTKMPRLELHTAEAVGPTSAREGQPHTYVTGFNSSDPVTRSFCSRCGTNLTYWKHPTTPQSFNTIDITVGSLDKESINITRPERHGWWDSGINWLKWMLRSGDGCLIRHPTGDLRLATEE